MKKNHSQCERALERIKTLFSQGKDLLYSRSLGPLIRSRHCNLVKMPRVPQVHQLSLLGYEMAKEKKKIQGVSWAQEGPSVQMPQTCLNSEGSILKSDRFHRYKLKEHLLASKRLKSLKKEQKEEMGKHEISLLTEPNSKSKKEPEIDYWEEFRKGKQERHYNITRITKILTD